MPSIKHSIAVDLLSRFPNAPTKTLARIAYRDNPGVWPNLDAARGYFRIRRGAKGDTIRKETTDKTFYRKPQKPGAVWETLPEPIKILGDWGSVDFDGPFMAIVMNDIHIPFYDKTALICALEDAGKLKIDLILLNGDIGDFWAESDYEKDPRKRDFPQEIKDVKDFLKVLRETFPKSRIIYKLGNHELRHRSYMRVKAPELLGLPEFEFESVLGLSALDIQMVDNDAPIKLGSLYVLHGHEYRFSISNPVNPARGLFLRSKANAACGHFHQTSQHSERSLNQKVLSTWSIGCLCDLHPEYRPLNNWNHGFMLVDVDKNNSFEVGNRRILHGKAFY